MFWLFLVRSACAFRAHVLCKFVWVSFTLVPLLLNIMIHNSPTCSRKKISSLLPNTFMNRPCQPANFPFALSRMYCRWTILSLAKVSGSPRYWTGKLTRASGNSASTPSMSVFTVLFSMLIFSPVASPNAFMIWTIILMSDRLGLVKITASSAYRETLSFACLSEWCKESLFL